MVVGNVTSLTNNGLRDWLLQRISAVVLAVYTIVLVIFFTLYPHPSYGEWTHFFQHTVVRLLTFVVALNLVVHAWIGIWTVTTDYLKCVCLRLTMQVLVALLLISCLAWGITIIWGV